MQILQIIIFEFKVKFLENTETNGANGILKI